MNEENKNLVPEETMENNEINLNEAVSDSSDVTQSTIENKKKNGNKLKILLFSTIAIAFVAIFSVGWYYYQEYLKNKDLEEHFGTQTLTKDETKALADNIVFGDDSTNTYDSSSSNSADSIATHLFVLKTVIDTNTHIDIAMTSDQKEEYLSKINEYISSANEYWEINNADTVAAFKTLISDSNDLNDMLSSWNSYYEETKEDLSSYSEDLLKITNKALKNKKISSSEWEDINSLLTKIYNLVDKDE